MDDVQFIQHLEAMGATRGLKPDDLWEMSGVDRTVWGRVKAGKRRASRKNYDRLRKLEDELKSLPLRPKARKVA